MEFRGADDNFLHSNWIEGSTVRILDATYELISSLYIYIVQRPKLISTYGLREDTFYVDDVIIDNDIVLFVLRQETFHLFGCVVRDKPKPPEKRILTLDFFLCWVCCDQGYVKNVTSNQ